MSVTQTYRGRADLTISGVSVDLTSIGLTDPGVEQELISYTVPAGKKLIALQIYSSCTMETKIRFLIDSVQYGSWRHNAASVNSHFTFSPYREINEGEIIKIKNIAASYRPQTEIEVYFQARVVSI